MKKSIILSFFVLFSIKSFSQEGGSITFDKNSHDFGTVKEETGSIMHEFKFTNTGKAPVIISNVKASCGCTTPDWTKEPVMPGQTGFIKAMYNTSNRPGAFNKSLTVTSNTEPSSNTLFISGNVTPKVKSPEEEYPKKIGNSRFISEALDFGKINTKDLVVREFPVYNSGSTPLIFSTPQGLPKYIQMTITPATLPTLQKGTIKVTYDPKKKNDLGPVSDKITIVTNEVTENKKTLMIKADISEYYAPLSAEQLALAPKLEFTAPSTDLGMVKVKSVTTGYIEFTNTGKQDLTIKKVRTSGGSLVAQAEKTTVKAGAKGKIKLTYTASDKAGPEGFLVFIHCNDPSLTTQTANVKVNVGQ
jgi:hypothetical protein